MEGLRPGDPERVGRYRLLRRLGTGGMGRVYLGQSPSGRSVAVKVIRAELADDADFRQRFRLEVTAARQVSGMFTAPVVDADPDAPQPWMVTAFVSGPSLADAVASRGALSVKAVRILAAGLAEGLSAVHAAGLVHRDLKPSNVLLAADGPRIIDFGISRSAGAAGPTRAGGVIGSPGFMSPEQARGEPVGPASDIFSLGSVLAFAATGEPPFGDGPPSVLLYRVVHGNPTTDNLPPELRPIIEHCLRQDPAARPTTDELLAQLDGAAPVAGWQAGPAVAAPVESPAVPAGGPLPFPAEAGAEVALTEAAADAGELPDDSGPWTGQRSGSPAGTAAASSEAAPSRGSSLDWLPPELGNGLPPPAAPTPGRVDRGRRRARLAALGVLVVVIAGTLALSLLGRHDRNSGAAGSRGTQHARSSARPRSFAQSLAPGQAHGPLAAGTNAPAANSAGGASTTPTAKPSGANPPPATTAGPGAVVLAYFGAINHQDWPAAWALGGDNLYPSLAALTADYAGVTREAVTILSISGDTVTARIATTVVTGTVAVHTQTFVVQDGVIVSRGPAPPPPGAQPG